MAGAEIWGLTGGIASGKSTVANLFSQEGVPVIDADQVARELSQEGGPAHEKILKAFGTADRSELRKIVFSDPKARVKLESIMHPLIQEESLRRVHEATLMAKALTKGRSKLKPLRVVYEAALLVENGRYQEMDGLIVVEAPLETRIERLMKRDQIDRELAEKMISAQIDDKTRRAAADLVIFNAGDQSSLLQQVREIVRSWQGEPKPTLQN